MDQSGSVGLCPVCQREGGPGRRECKGVAGLPTQQRMMSQRSRMGASVLSPRGLECVLETRCPACTRADRNWIPDGGVHLSTELMLCTSTDSGTSSNSCSPPRASAEAQEGTTLNSRYCGPIPCRSSGTGAVHCRENRA